MSKLIDSLNRVQETMTEKSAAAVQPKQTWKPREPVEKPTPVSVHAPVVSADAHKGFLINKQVFYSVFVAVMVIVVMALVLSYKAFTLISERNSELTKLAGIITKQNEKMRSLESSIQELNVQQNQQLALIKESFNSVEKLINTNTKELAEMAVNQEILNNSLKDLKASDKDIKNNYNYLSAEINRVKQIMAKMMGEAAIPPAAQ